MVCNVGGKGKGAFIIIFPKALLCVAVFSELSFMYILLNSPKSSRHQGLENEKWLLLLPCFAQDPETPHVSGFPDRLHTPPSLAVIWGPRRAVYSFITITEAHMALGGSRGREETYKNYFNAHMAFQFLQSWSCSLFLKPSTFKKIRENLSQFSQNNLFPQYQTLTFW